MDGPKNGNNLMIVVEISNLTHRKIVWFEIIEKLFTYVIIETNWSKESKPI